MPTLQEPAKPKDKPTNTPQIKMLKRVGPGVVNSKDDFGKLKPTNKVEFRMPDNTLSRWQDSMNKSLGGFKK